MKLIEIDEYDYIKQQAFNLQNGKDIEEPKSLAEYLMEMSRSDERELINYCKHLISHMLKCVYQPEKISSSWHRTILNSADNVSKIVTESKKLYNYYVNQFNNIYNKAVKEAIIDTGLNNNIFPNECEWTVDQLINEEFIDNFIKQHEVQPPK